MTIGVGLQRDLFRLYKQVAMDVVVCGGMIADVVISPTAFAGAIMEAQKDFWALNYRRLPNGYSAGKVAGVFVFRLSRWHIISLPEQLASNKVAIQLNYLVALAFGMKLMELNLATIPDVLHRELQYGLIRRHMNQETLGLCFDCLSEYNRLQPPAGNAA